VRAALGDAVNEDKNTARGLDVADLEKLRTASRSSSADRRPIRKATASRLPLRAASRPVRSRPSSAPIRLPDQRAARRGASVLKMRDVARHKSMDVLQAYVRDADLFRDHAGAGLL
jgi:hypothetical protein